MTPSREAIPSGILPVKWLDESSSSDKEYPKAVLYHHRKIAEHVHELYELGYKTLIRGSAVGMEKMAKKKNKSRSQALNSVKFPIHVGIRPENIFHDRSRTYRCLHIVKDDGNFPDNLLLRKINTRNPLDFKHNGISPSTRLLAKFSPPRLLI